MDVKELNNELGNIDLYLLDQILKNKIKKTDKILDAGCGEGRNLIYFLNNKFDVHGIDVNPDAIKMLQFILGSKYPYINKSQFIEGSIENMPYSQNTFEYVICSAVLHFATNESRFWNMFEECHRVICPGGTLFIRMASDIGLIGHREQDTNTHLLPDGSIRFLLKQSMIDKILSIYNMNLTEPLKTVRVEGKRCMSTLVLQKI